MADFKPSQVLLDVIPLVATMGKAEVEFTAAYLVRALVVKGDEWKALSLSAVADVARDDMTEQREPMRYWANPFVHPSPWLMVERGFAVFGESPEGETIAFTEKGLEAMRRWVRAEAGRG